MNTFPLEADTRVLIDKSLENLGWALTGNNQNVFFEQPKTEDEKKLLGGKRPDYVLYAKDEHGEEIWFIRASVSGEPINSSKHHFETEVKAVTYNKIRIEKTASGFETEVVLDL